MSQVPTIPLDLPDLIKTANQLKMTGHLAISSNNLTYLNIQDEFIHQLFPLLNNPTILKPAYFGKNLTGAHITVIYPEENRTLHKSELGKEHSFKLQGVYAADLPWKTYFVIMVKCPSLLQLRNNYSLPNQLNFKNHWIDFHITIGYKNK